MKNLIRAPFKFSALLTLMAAGLSAQQVKRTPFDVQSYLIDAQLAPVENKLTATTDVTFIPQEDTRSVTFELNGSLKIDSITRVGATAPTAAAPVVKGKNAKPAATTTAAAPAGEVTFVQDQVGVSDLGPSVRIDLGGDVTKGTPVTLRFKYSGVLNTPQGGPLLNKRLAYVGDNQGYLLYAARWFPFRHPGVSE